MRRQLMATVTAATLALGGMAGTAAAQEDDDDARRPSDRDRSFLRETARDSYFEIAAAELAARNATTPEAKALAAELMTDHTAAATALAALADRWDVRIPTRMTGEQRDTLRWLGRQDGIDFDDEYTEILVRDHREAVKDARQQARRGDNEEITELAEAMVPHLREHLEASRRTNRLIERAETALEDLEEEQERREEADDERREERREQRRDDVRDVRDDDRHEDR